MKTVAELSSYCHSQKLMNIICANTTSIVESGGFLLPPIMKNKGIDRDVPGQLFRTMLESNLCSLKITDGLTKFVAYADDLTACINVSSIPAFNGFLNSLKTVYGLQTNPNKSEIVLRHIAGDCIQPQERGFQSTCCRCYFSR